MQLNLKKCKEMIIDFRRQKTVIPCLKVAGTTLERVTCFKLLGLWIDDNLKWNTNTEHIVKKAAKRLYFLKVLKSYGAPEKDLNTFYTSVIRSVLELEHKFGMAVSLVNNVRISKGFKGERLE